jgi:folate-dependent phosphoribosylglycinamide formyltransferase PurN
MRIVILTTDTAHHRYFLQQLEREMPDGAKIVLNLFETKRYPWRKKSRLHFMRSLPDIWKATALNPYVQSKALAHREAEFEESGFFPDGNREVPGSFPTRYVHSVNDDLTQSLLEEAAADLYLVYGTGKIYPRVFERPKIATLNAHGGLLPGYRGLDTNLWAAFGGSPEDMAVTIHHIDAELDTGAVCLQQNIEPIVGLDIHTLRFHTTKICTNLFLEAIRRSLNDDLVTLKQSGESQYFGPMPVKLKRKVGRILRAYGAITNN